jgi:hypothetical protein
LSRGERAGISHPEPDGRLQARSARHRSGHLVAGHPGGAGAGRGGATARLSRGPSGGQRAGIYQPGGGPVGVDPRRAAALHRSRPAHAELVHRELQREVSGGMPEPELVCELATMRGESSKPGPWTTTRYGRAAVWSIGPQWSSPPKSAGNKAVEKPLRGKVQTTFPLRLEIHPKARDSHFPTAPAMTGD